ncbi:MAG TPA: glutamine--fructose-6-phosphate transaminase (isomerizing) [Candidatus Bathyarchaeia archaeon]|nr:glutamine--fructose-6-phosphate transaminase (isomerizing) [Candidatus Bathyarchaeia archaeon]
MCSVVGYVGSQFGRSAIMEGLRRLEYRGYDSAGIAGIIPQTRQFFCQKVTGSLDRLTARMAQVADDGYIGIGHTRWATHGMISEYNAHPQFDCHDTVALVHNGIIENYHILHQQLQKNGHIFISQTDTEVIAHLVEQRLAEKKSLIDAILSVVGYLEGAYACIVMTQAHPDTLIAIRRRSPLCIGFGSDTIMVASDVLAFTQQVRSVMYIPDNSVALVKKDTCVVYDFSGSVRDLTRIAFTDTWEDDKKGYEHYMLKEIYEQRSAIVRTVTVLENSRDELLQKCGLTPSYMSCVQKIMLLGCGTSWHAARIAQFFFETLCAVPTRVCLASEFRSMPFFPEDSMCALALSQSGETADTLEAIRMIYGIMPTIGITNVASSTITRETTGVLVTQAGPEIAVASTKAFSTQLATLYWLALNIAREKKRIDHAAYDHAVREIFSAAELLESTMTEYAHAIETRQAPLYASYDKAMFLGRHMSYPFALEAALKLKEVAYVFSQGYPAGELKHGPLALIDATVPIFLFSSLDHAIYIKLLSNAQEAKARGGHLVVFAWQGQDELINLADTVFIFPPITPLLGPLAMTGLMQLLVYYIAKERGCSIDKPRNLAKSVTVE